jgi:hypothetical protein
MSDMKKTSKSDWDRVKRDAASEVPVAYDPETDLYDPNDPAQVAAFFTQAERRPICGLTKPVSCISTRANCNE